MLKKKGFASVKKLLFLVLSLVVVLSIFTLTSSTTYAATTPHLSKNHQNANPAASGGGCDQWRWSSGGDIGAKGCISYNYFAGGLLPDGYVDFFPRNNNVSSCQVSVLVYDASNNYQYGQSWNCTSAANSYAQNQHYGFSGKPTANNVHSEIFVTMRYPDHTISWVGSDSPVQSY